MKRNVYLLTAIVIGLFVFGAIVADAQGPRPGGRNAPTAALGSGFTYQGQLKQNGAPVNGTCNLAFRLFDDVSTGTQIGSAITQTLVITNGLFTTQLNASNEFGASGFDGNARWLDIQVSTSCPSGGSFTPLSPRQALMPAPYALFSAAPWVTSGSNLSYNAGKVGIGTTTPAHRLSILGGPTWTSNGWSGALELSNVSAIGWQANSGGQRFGLGQTDGGLYFFRTASNPGTTASPATYDMIINDVGNVGIGTSTPGKRLTVRGPDTSGSTIAFEVQNSSGQFGLLVYDDKTVQVGALFGSSTVHACYNIGAFSACGSAAEYVPTIDDGAGLAQSAELVSIALTVKNPYDDEHSPFVVTKAARPCDENLLGFIVNPESGADGKKLNDHYLPLAIYGYFPAKVTLENGAIHRGDAITSSSKPGYGMKATQACKIIGYALEDANQEGTIQIFANHGETAVSEVASLRGQVQELKQTVANLKQEKDAQIAAQQKQINSLEARLTTLEQQASNANPGSDSQQVMLGLGALAMIGVVYQQHRTNRGGQ